MVNCPPISLIMSSIFLAMALLFHGRTLAQSVGETTNHDSDSSLSVVRNCPLHRYSGPFHMGGQLVKLAKS